MVDQMIIQTIGILLTGLTLSIAAIYYTLTLRYSRRNQDLQLETRQAQFFMQFWSQYTNSKYKDFREIMSLEWEDYDDAMEKYWASKDLQDKLESINFFMEGYGAYVREGLIDIRLVACVSTNIIRAYWEKFGALFLETRVRENNSRMYTETEYLYNALKEYIEKTPDIKWD